MTHKEGPRIEFDGTSQMEKSMIVTQLPSSLLIPVQLGVGSITGLEMLFWNQERTGVSLNEVPHLGLLASLQLSTSAHSEIV